MGRAGGGSSSGCHSFSGGHSSSSRSSGGHYAGHSSNSHRATGYSHSYNSGPSHSHSYHTTHHHYPPAPPRVYNRTYVYGSRPGCLSQITGSIVVIVIFVAVAIAIIISAIAGGGSGNVPASTVNREKLDSGNAFMNNCIIDDLGWFDNTSKVERALKDDFWDKTGVQPYIYLKEYDPSLTTTTQKEQWASQFYDYMFKNEDIFLFVYFAEEDTDNDVGYMCYVNGRSAATVMDSEAVGIFWSYVDSYWYDDMSTDDMFIKIFDKTADRIMQRTTTKTDVFKWVAIAVVIGVTGFVIIKVMKTKRKHDAEEAAETVRILNTPFEDTAEEQEADDLADKWS